MGPSLPQFVAPMLAVLGQPFDSDAHFFEIKWDGFRAAAMVEGGTVRLMSRNRIDLLPQFRSLSPLAALPDGLALDGEIVAFRDGKPDFDLMLHRGRGAGQKVVRFVAFDVLYQDYESRLALPFTQRREILEKVLRGVEIPELMLSDGMIGGGLALYRSACEQELEGVVAKKLSSPYASGKRNGAWVKIKRRLRIQVAVIGYIEKPGNDFQSLLVAGSGLPGEQPGPLRFLGRVGGGFTEASRTEMYGLLRAHPRAAPLVPCPEHGAWVEPGLYCEVSYAELTEGGLLRAPVFEGLIPG
ncbi:MAG TPA: ATP-dependent DNA ligase [Spirochaetia bacterium]|nr:ATP-dependent DNA ligase [Spirochaetia bacterium]